MSAPLECPEVGSLETLESAALAPDQVERWERHLSACPACRERLDRVQGEDTLLRLARRVGDPTAAALDPHLARIREHLHDLKGPDRITPAEPAELFFLGPADRPDLLGTLGGYQVEEVIGRGGMGIVLKAFEPALHRPVAIKVLAPALAGSATARRRFTREARAAAAVCHEHVVAVHGVHEADGLPYLVMQYVAGESLQARLDRTGPLEVTENVRIGLLAASGLAAAHAQGLVHRDVKPANILLEGGLARVKITDFGLARTADDVGVTRAGVVAGTPEYMAPEQARGEPVDHRADLFSLGSVLYALCTGRPPFRGGTALAVLRQVSEQEPTPIRSLNPDIPAWLEMFVSRLLAKAPAERLQSAAEVAALLEGYLAHLRQPATVRPPDLPPPPSESCPGPAAPGLWTEVGRRAPSFLRLAALVLPAALGLGMALWFAGVPGGPDARPEYAQEYHRSFRGDTGKSPGSEFFGPDAEQCLSFEPDGLRLTLPRGCPGVRPDTGLATNIVVKGNFEIIVDFEVLREPEAADAREKQTRFTVDVTLDRAGLNAATFSRMVDGKGPQFTTWLALQAEDSDKPQKRMHFFPGGGKAGRLRLVRSGAVLSYSQSGSRDKDFTVLQEYPFRTEDLKVVRLVGSTGGPSAALDVRFTDLCIRADSLPDLPQAAPQTAPQEGERKGWLAAGLILGLGIASSCAVGVWLYARRVGRGGKVTNPTPVGDQPAPPRAVTSSLSFFCAACGKRLKGRSELAGKKVRCPECGQAVHVPGGDTGGAGGTA
jgi:serine/threonine protein kinase